MRFVQKKTLPDFEGKHSRFAYNDVGEQSMEGQMKRRFVKMIPTKQGMVETFDEYLPASWKVMEAAQSSAGLSGRGYALQNVNHIAHLSGALVGVALMWLLSKVPSQPPDEEVSILNRKTNKD
ncbi:hypothetical protein IFM89_023043 [Coptis chinensis]|uniref:Peptidase S54 rhomboid domain-containing protein n=1 Tax=Coptis chinensis TaxID=261450 RepID=A0A835IF06_9MAGN|nr:hypothetical protein IFM89_023043 [Coptis chinensis]